MMVSRRGGELLAQHRNGERWHWRGGVPIPGCLLRPQTSLVWGWGGREIFTVSDFGTSREVAVLIAESIGVKRLVLALSVGATVALLW